MRVSALFMPLKGELWTIKCTSGLKTAENVTVYKAFLTKPLAYHNLIRVKLHKSFF